MSHRVKVSISLVICLMAIFVYLMARIWGNIPSVFPDEYIHAKNARFVPLAQADIPSYLYYATFRLTYFWDDQYLSVARALNAIFFLCGCYLIFSVARTFTTDTRSAYVAIVAAMSPLNTYINYFMAESMFFFFVWLFLWAIHSDDWRNSLRGNLILGLIFGCLLLVKPHALFILPVYPLALLTLGLPRGIYLKSMVLYLVAALAVKFVIGYTIAGSDGLSLFGSLYSRHADDVFTMEVDVAYVAKSFWVNLKGNSMSLVTVLGLAFIYLFVVTPRDAVPSKIRFLKWVIVWTLLIMVPFVCMFATTTALFDENVNNRIYMRYFNYILPLILIYAISADQQILKTTTSIDRIGLGLLFGLLMLYTGYHVMTSTYLLPYKIFITDTPEFFLILYSHSWFYILSTTSIIVLIVWVMHPKPAQQGYLYVFVPLSIIITSVNSHKAIESRNIPNAADKASVSIASIIPESQHGDLLAIGSDELILPQALMSLKSGSTVMMEVSRNDTLYIDAIQPEKSWILAMGNIPLEGKISKVVAGDGFTLYKRK